ncbi:MAG: hypothetical protein HRT73_02570, partial [Flavobacteriales bacterium]|nr:hypothetical protein [Flavobacteriales bacterium]
MVFKGLYNIIDTLFISGQKANGIFQFDLTSTVKNITIDSLSLIRGKSNFHGGAIYFNGDSLFVYNSSLTDNEGINGGAIYSNLITAKMIINNSCINNNKAGNGGGIYSKSLFDSSICITNSFINDNEVSTDGGGVYGVSIIVDNSEINNNRAYNGAGIYSDINYATSFLAINNSELAFNFVTNKGAGIYVGALNMKNTVLNSDTAVYGGALYISAPSQSITMISNSTLYNNYAGIGGAIYSIPSDSSFLTIDSSVIRNNYGHHGAGINVTTSIKSVTKILNSEVINNTSFQYGGGVNLSNLHNYTNLQLLVKNTVIKNNEATIQGGGIYCQTTGTTDSSKIVVEIDSSVIDSNLSNNGGGIFIIARADFNSKAISIIDVKNSTISNNVALTNGGGIFVESNTTGS